MKNLIRSKALLFMTMLIMFTCTILVAAGVEVLEGDPLAAILELVLNFKSMAPLALASAVIVFLVQAGRKFFPSSGVRKAVVTVLSVAYVIIQNVLSGGLGWVESGVLVLFTMGGATMIYNYAIKPLLKKAPA